MAADATPSVLDAIVAASGLSPVFARGAIVRALARTGLDATQVTRRDVRRALPAISAALKVFLTEAEHVARMQAIERLAA